MKNLMINSISIPAVGLGTFQLSGQGLTDNIVYALENGYRHIDTAQIYGNEHDVGRAITKVAIKRAELFLTTKIWINNFNPKDLYLSLKTSLDKLQTDYVDLLLLHWPVKYMPLNETLEALNEVCRKKYTKYIGVSNFTIAQMNEAIQLSKIPIAFNQIEFHPLLQQPRVINFAKAHHIGIMAHTSLAQGALIHEPTLKKIAEKHGKDFAQIIFRWLYQLNIPSLVRSNHKERLIANADIFDFELSAEDMAAINKLGTPAKRFIDPVELAPDWDN
ncbi:aldo/keto reductase [Legionella sp. D16C41]|uniref:aldo/keto reductase n=1 Tax=Legionella sp. D16C41 TaxID=3402688 RepID=UPI003AF52CFB